MGSKQGSFARRGMKSGPICRRFRRFSRFSEGKVLRNSNPRYWDKQGFTSGTATRAVSSRRLVERNDRGRSNRGRSICVVLRAGSSGFLIVGEQGPARSPTAASLIGFMIPRVDHEVRIARRASKLFTSKTHAKPLIGRASLGRLLLGKHALSRSAANSHRPLMQRAAAETTRASVVTNLSSMRRWADNEPKCGSGNRGAQKHPPVEPHRNSVGNQSAPARFSSQPKERKPLSKTTGNRRTSCGI